MLPPDQIDALSSRAEQISDRVSEFLISDIAERISEAGQLTGTASYEVWRVQNLGVSQKELKKKLQQLLEKSTDEIEDLMTQSAETGYNFDLSRFQTVDAIPFAENASLQQIVAAAVKLAREDFTNIVRTTGFVGPDGVVRELTDAYRNACDFAFQKTVTGAQDFHSAVRDATRNLAEKGIRYIDYKGGKHMSLEAAVRTSVMGGMGLMQEQISQSNHDYLGCDGWEISAHSASAPDHEPIQGKQYTDAEYTRLNNSLRRRIGTLNCGHAAFPIILGVNSPQYTPEQLERMRQENEKGVTFDGQHYTMYRATQRQRKFERSIRKQKRRILIDEKTGDKEKLQTDQIRLTRLRQEYKRFSKSTGLREQWERTEAAGFTWKHGKAAEKSLKKIFTSQESQSIMNIQDGGGRVTINNIEQPIEQRHTGKGNPNAILHFDVELNNRQKIILDTLSGFNSRTIVPKESANMADLAALTAKTGDEFAMFTKSGDRLIIRGNHFMVEITPEEAYKMGKEGYVWSGHTHPGVDFNALQPSAGDYVILNQFNQQNSAIYNSAGQYLVFERTEPYV